FRHAWRQPLSAPVVRDIAGKSAGGSAAPAPLAQRQGRLTESGISPIRSPCGWPPRGMTASRVRKWGRFQIRPQPVSSIPRSFQRFLTGGQDGRRGERFVVAAGRGGAGDGGG